MPFDNVVSRAAIEQSFDIVSLLTPAGIVLYESPSVSRILGFPSAGLIGSSLFDLVHPDDLPRFREEFHNVVTQAGGQLSAHRCRGATGEWRWLESVGTVLPEESRGGAGAILVNSRDITERKQAELALSRSETNFRNILDALPDGAIIHDGSRCIAINSALLEMIGCPVHEAMPEAVWKFLGDDSLNLVSVKDEQEFRQETVARRRDGSTLPVEVISKPYIHEGRQVRLAIVRDLTRQNEVSHETTRVNREILAIWDSITDGFFTLDSEWRFTYVNAEAERLMQRRREELLNRNVWEEFPEATGTIFDDQYHKAIAEQTAVYFETLYAPLELWVEVRAYPSSAGLAVYFRDITERKRAEDVQQRLASIVASSNDAIVSMDLDSVVTSWNYAAEQLFGYTAQEAIGQSLNALWPSSRQGETQRILAKLRKGEHIRCHETEQLHKEGHPIPVSLTAFPLTDAGGRIIGASAIVRDMTQERQAAETQTRLAAIVESSDDAISSLDLQGHITSWNRGAERLYGYTAEEVMGQPITILVPPDKSLEIRDLAQRVNQGESVRDLETRRRRKDGSLVEVSITISPMTDATGQLIGGSAITRDMTEHRKAEESLLRTQRLYQALAHNFPNGVVYLLDRDGRVVLAEGRGLATMGSSPEMAVGRTMWSLVGGQELRDRLETAHKTALLGGESALEIEVRDRLHSIHFVPVHVDDNDVATVMAVTQDITERKRAEEAQERLATIVESSTDAIISETVDGVITSWNSGAEQMFGYKAWEAVGKHVNMLLPESGFEEERLRLERLRRGERILFETRRVHKNGRMVDVSVSNSPVLNASGQVVAISSIARDISAQKEAEADHSRLAALLESTTDLVAWTDSTIRLHYVNPAGRAMLGIKPNEPVEGRSLADFVPEWVNKILENVAIPIAFQSGTWSGELAVLGKDGQGIPVSQVITAHPDIDGKNILYSMIARDTSESQRARAILERANEDLEERVERRTADLASANRKLQSEVSERQMAVGALREVVEKLEQAREEAEEAQREADSANRAKSEFLSRMSHELRTPLNAIIGFGQVLEMRELSPRDSRGVDQILKAGRHLLQLINEVLEIARIEAGHLTLSIEPIDLVPLLKEVLSLVQPLAAQRQILLLNEVEQTAATTRERYVMADRQRLRQVMLNLLSNAIKYNHEGGTVTIALHEVRRGEAEDADSWRIEVSDTGPGIELEDQQKIFLPFERLGAATSNIEGTGIGLTLTQRMVELMNGFIGVDSLPGRGSTFWVELEAAENPAGRIEHFDAKTAPPDSPLLVGRVATILYIEDNASNLILMETLFEEMPQVRLLSAMQGGIGLELARKHQPDLILLDLHLPDLQGDEVLRQLQADPTTSHIPVVMLSADATPNQIDRLLAAGARHYLTKPLNLKQLVRVLDELLRNKTHDPIPEGLETTVCG